MRSSRSSRGDASTGAWRIPGRPMVAALGWKTVASMIHVPGWILVSVLKVSKVNEVVPGTTPLPGTEALTVELSTSSAPRVVWKWARRSKTTTVMFAAYLSATLGI